MNKMHEQDARGGWYKYDLNFAVPQRAAGVGGSD